MTGQTLQTLQNYPNEREPIFANDVSIDTTKIQGDFNVLNTKKADIDKVNTFSAIQTFSGGIAKTGSKITESTYIVTSADVSLYFDTTTNAIVVTLPEASTVLNQEFDFVLKTNVVRSGSNSVQINTDGSDTLNPTGNNSIALNEQDDYIKIKSIGTGRWLIITNNNCALSTI